MQQKTIGFVVLAAAIAGAAAACATGTAADARPGRDGGPVKTDSGTTGNDGSTIPKDSGTTQKDSSTPIQDGSTCNFTVCGNLCVDTSSDDNNCGQCNNPCLGGSSCTNSQCQCSGGMTLCNSVCVDTMTDNSNCGGCNAPCTGNSTCMNGSCQTQASGAPPQGSCAHDLCTASLGYLDMGCDPSGCVTNVCNADSFCCDSSFGDWDSICVGEVAQYCPPYSCP